MTSFKTQTSIYNVSFFYLELYVHEQLLTLLDELFVVDVL